jgi:hypothetical protein
LWLVKTLIIRSALPRVETKSSALRMTMGTAFLGGVARLVSSRKVGRTPRIFVAAIGLELVGMPAIAIWQSRVVNLAKSRAKGWADQGIDLNCEC